MKKGRNSYLLKNTLIFTLGNLGSKFISFFLIPLYTNILSTGEYGIIDLISTITTVLIPILTINICESVMRFSLDKDADKSQITQIGTYIFIIGSIIGLGIIPICNKIFEISSLSYLVYFYIITLAASQLYLCDLRGKELLFLYSIGNIGHTFFIAIFNILFLKIFDLGIEGYLLAYIISNLITTIFALIVGKGYKSFKFKKINFTLLKKMSKYSFVLIPNSFMWWIINSSDRLMITQMISVSANGIYSISYKIPTLVSTLTTIFNQAWSYSAIKEDGAKDEEDYNNQIFKYLIVVTMLIAVGILTFIKPFLKVYVSSEFFSAWKYTPFLIIGYVYLTLGTFMATSYTVHKDSFGYLFSGMFGAVFNILLNLILIPIIGIYGAAIATCLSYILVFSFRLVHTRKYIKYKIQNFEFIYGTATLLISSIFIYMDNFYGFFIQILLYIVMIYLFYRKNKTIFFHKKRRV